MTAYQKGDKVVAIRDYHYANDGRLSGPALVKGKVYTVEKEKDQNGFVYVRAENGKMDGFQPEMFFCPVTAALGEIDPQFHRYLQVLKELRA